MRTTPSLSPFAFVGNQTDPFHTVAPGNPNLEEGYQYADATLFVDPRSRRAFVYWRTRVDPQDTGFRAMRLTPALGKGWRRVSPYLNSSRTIRFTTPVQQRHQQATPRVPLVQLQPDGWIPMLISSKKPPVRW